MRKRRQTRQLYGTKQVAKILELPEWRVKNFTEGGAYGLRTQTLGTGRGSRRLYETTDICRIAVANELVNCGFTPEAVGRAVREIPESLLNEAVWPVEAEEEDEMEAELEGPPMLVYMHDKWKVRRRREFAGALDKYFGWDGEATGIFVLNIWSLLDKLGRKIHAFLLPQTEQQQ